MRGSELPSGVPELLSSNFPKDEGAVRPYLSLSNIFSQSGVPERLVSE